MYKNYVTTALRNLFKNKLYSAINILGLTVGLAAGLLIFLFVRWELSYDQWVPDGERIYRLHSTYEIPGRSPFRTVRSSGPMAENLPLSFPEIESIVRLNYISPTILHEGEAFNQQVTMVDPSFFDVFDLPMAEGTPEGALRDFSSILISESTRQRYFGDQPALGKTMVFCCLQGQTIDLKVTGVLKDIADNSHLDFQALILINKEAFRQSPWMFESWTSVNNHTFIKFRPGTDIAAFEAGLPAFIDEKIPPNPDAGVGKTSDFMKLSLMNLRDLHLRAGFQASDVGDIKPLGSMTSVIGFAATAILILIIASINFMNLSTARSSLRAREVSLRKVVGASKKQLVQQFLGESFIITAIAMILAIVAVELTLPWYNNFLNLELSLNLFTDPVLIPALVAAVTLLGAISGLYPAFNLSAFKPARILAANQSSASSKMGGLRTALVVVQFSVTVALLIITAVVYIQTEYAKSVELGFERENRLVLRGVRDGANADSRTAFVNEVRRLPEVRAAVLSSDVPTDNNENNNGFALAGDESARNYALNIISTDYGFMEAYGIDLLAGRDLSQEFGSDNIVLPPEEGVVQTVSALVNESAARHLGFSDPQAALGAILRSDVFEAGPIEHRIVGVIPDLQMRSVKYDARPTIYFRSEARLNDLTIVFDGGNAPALIDKIEAMWRENYPRTPFTYTFLNDLITGQYAEEDRQSTVFLFFTGLAILVASLGLFGLASFAIVQRTKEVGIRKVLGADIPDIVRLMLWQFSKPVLIANLIAWPVAWYLSQNWLEGFEQRISAFNPFIFAGATLAALLIAWITVGGHAIRVARSNPVHALRYE